MYQDLIIIFGIIFFIYKLITHKGKLSLARIIYTFSLVFVGMYFMIKNNEFESDKVEMYQSNFKAGVYAWLFLVALYIFLYVLTYY